jgi:hypothetical protein
MSYAQCRHSSNATGADRLGTVLVKFWVRVRRVAVAVLVGAAFWTRAGVALAQIDWTQSDPNAIQIHAFVSQGFILSSGNNYLSSLSEKGSFEYTEVGINFTKNLTEDLRMGVQIYAHDIGPIGNYTPTFDWYYLDYHFRDWLGIRAGHVKIPFGLYNESSEVDSARVPVLLPQSVYPVTNQESLLAQTGGEIYGNLRLGALGALEYRAYGGTLAVASTPGLGAGITTSNLRVPYVVGGRLMWQAPLDGLQMGASIQQFVVDGQYNFTPQAAMAYQPLLPANFNGTLPAELRGTLWVASLEYQAGNLLLAGEYSRWTVGLETPEAPALTSHGVNERYYGMLAYHVARWFTPGVYYAVYYPDIHQREGRQSYQRDAAVSLRYDINSHWLVKLEGHFMDGTAEVDTTLNGNQDPKTATQDWGVFFVKTTAYF